MMSGIISSIAFESELNGIVREYLNICGYSQSVRSFDQECKDRGKTISAVPEGSGRQNSSAKNVQMDMINCLRRGARPEFFQLWEQHLPDRIRNKDPIAQKLEFYIHIYFAIYPINHPPSTSAECEEAMKFFRQFIETRGASLSQTTEFLPFYALPYVPDPKVHPSYKELFGPHWVPDLELRLHRFLDLAMESNAQPRLFDLYTGNAKPSSGAASSGGKGDDLSSREAIQRNIVEAESRAMQYMKLYHKSQSNYFNLIGITADLVDSLERSVQGVPVTPESVQEILSRLFVSQGQQTSMMDFSRPGTASKALRQSIMPSAQDEALRSSVAAAPPPPPPAAAATNREQPPPMRPTPVPLNYAKIKADLAGDDMKKMCALLQALRWRLTRSSEEALKNSISNYLTNDLLSIAIVGRPNALDCLSSTDPMVVEYMARLLNAFASLYSGRSYLVQSAEPIDAMVQCLKAREDQPNVRDQLMGALQKLSLRAFCQKRLINDHGMVQWLIDLLEEHDQLSEYGLEYSSALCMNLCLRPSGRKMCTPIAKKALKVLSDLLGHEQKEIVPYVNGTLYSILGVPEIRKEARAMDMEGILKCFIREDEPHTNRQIEYIIRQLNSQDAEDPGAAGDDPEPEEDEDEEEDDPDIELGPDKDEKFCDYEPSGEALLAGHYSSAQRPSNAGAGGGSGSRLNSAQLAAVKASEAPITRPVTPGMHRSPANSAGAGGHGEAAAAGLQRPPTRSGRDTAEKSKRQPSAGSTAEYNAGFASRPLVPRTPDPRAGDNSAPPPSTPPKPTYSGGLPTSSRPNSASARPTSGGGGGGSRRSSRGNNGGQSGAPGTPRK